MAKVRYQYNESTLSYEKVKVSTGQRLIRGLIFVMASLFFSAGIYVLFETVYDSPKDRQLQAENQDLMLQLELIDKRVDQMGLILADLENRDDNIYRAVFEVEPIPDNLRRAGIGGVNRYKNLEKFKGSADIVISATKKLDRLAKQLYIQSKSFDEIYSLAKQKEEMLASIPAIQPVSNKDLTRLASGFGMRIDPLYKTPAFHEGMDFTAPTGTPIYATGNGTVIRADRKARGYGNHVRLDHGFGYMTLYAHMSDIAVKPGQEVLRGEIIGYVGNTGKSSGPHLHYEVHKNDRPVNPINFYFSDLTPEEFDMMIQLASQENQSFD
ncbi:MAG: M23 family metallopeptidase [Flavobacteriales bacterium]|nr:M23 family metallopeptidase [Flavobacteriales bacterium]